jgi:hypothetical protein
LRSVKDEGAIMRRAQTQGNTTPPLPALTVLALARQLNRLRSAKSPLAVALVGLMPADDAARDRADFAVACHFAGNTADQCAFDTAFCIR